MLLPIETFTFPEAYALVGTMATDSASAIAMATRTIFEEVILSIAFSFIFSRPPLHRQVLAAMRGA